MADEEEEAPVIVFSECVDLVRRERAHDESLSVQEAVDRILVSSGQSRSELLNLYEAPSNETENFVFDALVARQEIQILSFCSTVDASCIANLLDRTKQNIEMINMRGMPMSKKQASEIFTKLCSTRLDQFSITFRNDYCHGFIRAFVQYVRQASSLFALGLVCEDGEWISEHFFNSLCAAIPESSTEFLFLGGFGVQGITSDRVHEVLSDTILHSPSTISHIHFDPRNPGDVSRESLSGALRHHHAIRNLDVSCRVNDQGNLRFDRNAWWKRLLAMDDIPLNLWPWILKKADTWTVETSQSHLDILYFLIKEKNANLLQNVHRRRIRKRKRYGLDE